MSRHTQIASHRGGSLCWPESSRTAFEQTASLPVEQVEFDVHLTRDGKIVVIHDAALDRTTDAAGFVQDRDWSYIQRAGLNGTEGERPLLLSELIDIFKPSTVDLRMEIKPGRDMIAYDGLARLACAAVKEHGMLERCTVTSFQLPILDDVRAAYPAATRLWLVSPQVQHCVGLEDVCGIAASHGIPALSFNIDHVGEADFAFVRERGLTAGAWGAHTRDRIEKAFALGCDAFTTDDPLTAIEVRRTLV